MTTPLNDKLTIDEFEQGYHVYIKNVTITNKQIERTLFIKNSEGEIKRTVIDEIQLLSADELLQGCIAHTSQNMLTPEQMRVSVMTTDGKKIRNYTLNCYGYQKNIPEQTNSSGHVTIRF